MLVSWNYARDLRRSGRSVMMTMIGHKCHNFYGAFRVFFCHAKTQCLIFMDVGHASSAHSLPRDCFMTVNYLLCNSIRRTLMTKDQPFNDDRKLTTLYNRYCTGQNLSRGNNSRLFLLSRFQLSRERIIEELRKSINFNESTAVGCVKNPPAGLRATISFGCAESDGIKN